jgi:hypothetical protein
MARDLPFFKFDISEYMFGRIQRQSMEIQGVFINLCCKYWHKLGDLSAEDASLDYGPEPMKKLLDAKIVHLDGDKIVIRFLDEQLEELDAVSKINAEKGRKSAEIKALKRQQQPTDDEPETTEAQPDSTDVEPLLTASQPDATEEKRREEKRREREAGKPAPTLEDRQREFYGRCMDYSAKYQKPMIEAFQRYWSEMNPGGKKMKFEMQQTFDVGRRLQKWFDNDRARAPGGAQIIPLSPKKEGTDNQAILDKLFENGG